MAEKGATQQAENRKRFKEILAVMKKHDIVRGVSPEKLFNVINELGPTFVKLGQILSTRSDVLPQVYCDELKKLRSNVPPMPYEQVSRQIERAYGQTPEEVFSFFDQTALGSASIAQAHAAVLKSGERVVAKIQREGIHETMSRDIQLLKQACKLLKYMPSRDLVDFNKVLDEMWIVTQQEMNFQTEANNLERFSKINADVAYVKVPAIYRELTTPQILVMERIDGIPLDDFEAIQSQGYDLDEIGKKLADNYVKQVIVDGFFHADPHPGNIRIQDGKIVWLDMGMMGVLSEHDRTLIASLIPAVAKHDISTCRNIVLQLGTFKGKTDKQRLEHDIEDMLEKYGTCDLGSIDIAVVMEDMTEIMRANGISMPASLTMLARGLGTVEGVVAELSPGLNIMDIVTARATADLLKNRDWKASIQKDVTAIWESAHKSLELPALLADALRSLNLGEINVSMRHHTGEDTEKLITDLVLKLCVAVVASALIICAGATWEAPPRINNGLSLCSICCLVTAVLLLLYMFVLKNRRRK